MGVDGTDTLECCVAIRQVHSVLTNLNRRVEDIAHPAADKRGNLIFAPHGRYHFYFGEDVGAVDAEGNGISAFYTVPVRRVGSGGDGGTKGLTLASRRPKLGYSNAEQSARRH